MLSKRLTLVVLLLSSLAASGKDKKKAPLPADILKAHTVWVVVDPTAGIDIEAPNANRIALGRCGEGPDQMGTSGARDQC